MSYLLKRKDVLLTIAVVSFAIIVIPYFIDVPSKTIEWSKLNIGQQILRVIDDYSGRHAIMVAVITNMAFILALYSQTRRSLLFVRQRIRGWPYQLYLIGAVYMMTFFGLAFGQTSDPYRWFQYAIYMPCSSVIYSILTFYMASAGARAFRARSPQALLLLSVGIVVLLGQAPLTGAVFPEINNVTQFFGATFAISASRMLTIGITLGAIVLGVRTLTGKEPATLGFTGEGT